MSWEFSRYHSGRFHGLEVDVTNLSLMVSEVKKKEFREYVLKKKKKDLEAMILTPVWI